MEAAGKWLRFSLHLLEWWKLGLVDISAAATQLKMPLGTGIYPDGIGTYHCGTSQWQPVNYYTVLVGLLKKSQQLESSSKWQTRGKTSRPGLKPEICRTYQQAHNISDWWEIRWGLQLVCWPVSSCWRRGKSVCLAVWYFSSSSLASSLQACFSMWPCSIIIMVLGEHEHFFWLHLFLSSHPSQMKWQVDWVGAVWKWMQRKCVTQQFSRELLSGKATILLTHWHQVPVPSEMKQAIYGWSFAAHQQGEGAAYSFLQNLFQVEREVSSPSLLKIFPVKGEKHWTRNM